MKFHVYLGVLLLAAIASAKFHPKIGESNMLSRSNLSKIVNGHPAVEGQYPYMVQIDGRWVCAGALISPSWVLTEGYCIIGIRVTVYLGSVDKTRPLLMIVTDDTRTHPLFNTSPMEYNIGLVNLMHSVSYTETIGPIALPRQSQIYADFGYGRTATVLGWGLTNDEGTPVELLHYGTVEIISSNGCRFTGGIHVFNTSICALPLEELQQNACAGDWGGPLVLHDMDDNIDIVAGVLIAHSYPECVSESPSIFIQPHHFWEWITNESGLPIRP